MLEHKVTAYEGTENYIFISYAHKDTDQVFPILEQLQSRGYRIWYDDGIAPGSEWPENIAQHLNDCAMTMAFISPNSMASANCRREINFALSKQKPFLSVVLEPTEMPLGMELQLSAQQSVIRYNYRTNSKFLEKLCSCPDLEASRIPQETEEATEVPPVQEAEPPVYREAPKPEKPKKAPREKKQTPAFVRKFFKSLSQYLLAALILVGLLLMVSKILESSNRLQFNSDVIVQKDDTSLSLRDMDLGTGAFELINQMDQLEYVSFTNCNFQLGALASWKTLGQVASITMENCTGDLYLQFLTNVPNLRSLHLQNSNVTDVNFPILTQQSLSRVELPNNHQFTDTTKLSALTQLRYLDLTSTGITTLEHVALPSLYDLSFRSTGISDVSPLRACLSLNRIDGAYSQVQNISALAELEKLSAIDFEGCSNLKVTGSFQSLRMRDLNLRCCGMESLKPFANMTQLANVNLAMNPLKNSALEFLAKSAESLKHLDLSDTQFSSTSDVSWLSSCTNLQELNISGTKCRDLDFLSDMEKLKTLWAECCGISDLTGLQNCTALKHLYLAKNNMTSLDGLETLTRNDNEFLYLDLSFCSNLSDASALPGVKFSRLCLAGCELLNYADMQTATGSYITLSFNDTLWDSPLIPDGFSTYYVMGCPDDQKVALEDTIASYKVDYFHNFSELADLMDAMDMPYMRLICDHCSGSGLGPNNSVCTICDGTGIH